MVARWLEGSLHQPSCEAAYTHAKMTITRRVDAVQASEVAQLDTVALLKGAFYPII